MHFDVRDIFKISVFPLSFETSLLYLIVLSISIKYILIFDISWHERVYKIFTFFKINFYKTNGFLKTIFIIRVYVIFIRRIEPL